jgi:hypothetical protein
MYPITDLKRSLGLQENEHARTSKQSAHEGGKIVSHAHRLPLSQEISLVILLLEAESTPTATAWPEQCSAGSTLFLDERKNG